MKRSRFVGWAMLFFCGVQLAVMIWAAFDLHNRMPFVMLAQIPTLLCYGGWKVLK